MPSSEDARECCEACGLALDPPSAPCPRCTARARRAERPTLASGSRVGRRRERSESDGREKRARPDDRGSTSTGSSTGTQPAPHDAPDLERRPGDVVGERYRVDRTLGRGGFAAVHEATDLKLGRKVALKVLRAGTARRRFLREARVLARLDHPNVVTAHDVGQDGPHDYIVLERVVGESLDRRLEQGPLPWDEVCRMGADLAGALDHAHDQGVVHRDVKPANVLVTDAGTVKLTDFGVAKAHDLDSLTDDGTLIGTAGYMAPEVLRGDKPDGRADIYSLGVLLFRALTGRRPFESDNIEGLVAAAMADEPPAPSRYRDGLPAELDEIVLRCLRKEASRRPASARELEVELAALLTPRVRPEAPASEPVPPRLSAGVVRPPARGGRRRVVLLQVRLQHLEELAEEISSQALASHRQAARRLKLAALERFGGLVLDEQFDALTIVFGLPVQHEKDADRAVELAEHLLARLDGLDLEGRTLRVCAAVHVGVVVAAAGEETFRLRTDSRRVLDHLAQVAPPGELRLSQPLRESLRDRSRLESARELLAGPEGTSTATWRLTPAPLDVGARGPGLPLLGRDLELALVLEAGGRALAGRGAIVTLEGPAGIGKTRLVEEVLLRLRERQEVTIVEVEARDYGAAGPYQVFRDVLKGLGERADPLATGLGAAESRLLEALGTARWDVPALRHLEREDLTLALRATWSRLLSRLCEERPVVLVLEDMHWGDAASWSLLSQLVDVFPGLPLLGLFTWRLDEARSRPEWSGRPFHRPVVLGPLPPEAERALLSAALEVEAIPERLGRLLEERSEGNPLYAVEFARALREQLAETGRDLDDESTGEHLRTPATLQGILAARIDKLVPATRAYLQSAAVVGREFPLWLSAIAAGEDEDAAIAAVEELVRADLVMEQAAGDEPTWSFQHALLRDVAYDALPRGARQVAHRRVAEALQALDDEPPAEVAEEIGRHLAQSDEPREAIPWLERAAAECRRAGTVDRSVQLLRQALELLGEAGPAARRAALLHQIAQHEMDRDGWPAAIEASRASVALAREAKDARTEAWGRAVLGRALRWLERRDEGSAEMEAAERLALELDDRELRCQLLLSNSTHLYRVGETTRAEELLETLQGLEPPQGVRVDALRMLSIIRYHQGRDLRALELAREGLALADRIEDVPKWVGALESLSNILMVLGRYEEAEGEATTGLNHAREHLRPRGIIHFGKVLAHLHWQQGRLASGLRRAREAEQVARSAAQPWHLATSLYITGLLLHEAGQHAEARAVLMEGHETARLIDSPTTRANSLLALARVEVTLGLIDRASEHLDGVLQSANAMANRFQQCEALMLRARGARADGRPDAAWNSARELEPLSRQCGDLESLVPSLVEAARAGAGAGRAREVRPWAEEAVTAALRSGRRIDAAGARVAMAEVELQLGDLHAARQHATEALREAEEVGLPELAWEARRVAGRAMEAAGIAEAFETLEQARKGIMAIANELPAELRETYLNRTDRRELLDG